jgi:CRP/FNR family transcriptional regulator, cyclic AMP receptor protein
MASDRRSLDLKDIWLFSNCTQSELRKIRGSLDQAEVDEGQLLVEEGEMGSYLFVIVSGRAQVRRKGRTVSELGPGDHFGELSLLDRKPHSASVVCTTDMEMLILSRRHFDRLLTSVPTITGKMFKSMATRLRASDALSYD